MPALRALQLFASPDVKIRQVARDETVGISFRGARRVYSWVASEAVRWDRAQGTLVKAPGYDLVRGGTKDEPTLQLVRV